MRTIITTWVAVIATLFPTLAMGALPPTRVSGQSDALSTTFDFKTPYSQATKYSGTGSLLELDSYNVLKNPRFEATTYNTSWTASGGTVAAAATTNIFFSKGATWDSGSASQTFTSDAITVPEGFKGNNCEASMYIKVPSGTITSLIQAWDGTNVLATQTIVNSTLFTKNTVTFPCPTSGTFAIRILSVAADEPLIALDEGYLGLARNVGVADLTTETKAYTPLLTSSGGGAVTLNATSVVNPTGEYRRVGDRLFGEVTFRNGSGGAASGSAGTVLVSIPSECVADTSKLPDAVAGFRVNGSFSYGTSGGSSNGSMFLSGTGNLVLLRDTSGSVSVSDVTASFFVSARFDLPCVGWAASTTVMPDAQGWFVSGEISGANPTLGVASVSSYTEIANATLTLTPQSGSAPMGIMCTGVNAAATPSTSATNCGGVNESVGFNANFPRSGFYEICAEFAHQAEVDSGEGLRATFQVIQTPTNAQTLSQETGSKVTSGTTGMAIATGVSSVVNTPHTRCGFFNLSAGTNGFRLMYEQIVGGTPNNSVLLSDGSASEGQRAIRWSAKPVSQQQQAILTNSVSTDNTNGERSERARIASACGSVTSQSGSWISSTSSPGTGQCTVNFKAGHFSSAPSCTCVTIGQRTCRMNSAATTSTVTFDMYDGSATPALVNTAIDVLCQGPR